MTSGAPWPSAPKTALSARRLQKKQGQIIVCKRTSEACVRFRTSMKVPRTCLTGTMASTIALLSAGLLIADLQPYPYPHTNVSVGA